MPNEYRLRVVVLSRTTPDQNTTGQKVDTWPEPPAGANRYYAARDQLAAGELLAQGLRQTTGSQRLRIKGGDLPIHTHDRLRFDSSRCSVRSQMYVITGVARDVEETVIDVDELSPKGRG